MRLPVLLVLALVPTFAQVSHHIVQLSPQGDRLMVVETFIWKGEKPGSIKIYIPQAGAESAQAGSFTLQKTSKANVYEIKTPAVAKDTPIQVAYQLPFNGEFTGKSMQPDAPTRFLVTKGLTLSGKNVEERQSPPGMSGAVYAATAPDYTVKLEGAPEPTPETPPAAKEDDSPGIERIPARVHERMYPVLGIAFAILALGFILLYRRTVK